VRTTYQLAVDFDWVSHTASISATIHYINHTGASLPELLLVIDAARQENVFTPQRITWPGGLQAGDFRIEGSFWHLPLAEPLEAGQRCTVEVSYHLQLLARGGVLGYTARQVNFGDWYPYVPPYRAGIGWLAYQPAAVGEHLNFDKADFEVTIAVTNAPAGWQILAPGVIEEVEGWWHFIWPNARSFAWSGSEQYVVAEKVFEGVRVRQATFAKHAQKGQAALQVIGNALALYGEHFGAYPHTELIAIESDFFDGMEYDGLFFLGEEYFLQHDGTAAGYLTALSAHETAHQWWYGAVGNDQAWEPWLDEALCTYSELLYYERYAPHLLPWWWEYRSDRFQPQGWVNSTVYDHPTFRGYVDAVYLRGAHFLHDLRLRVGEQAFLSALQTYFRQGDGQIATTADFFAALSAQTQVDYQDIVAAYFRADP
jgi:hypothetical protein